MYQIGDKVVHPMHGAGVIDSIVQRKVAGKVENYYLLKLSVGGMTVMKIGRASCRERVFEGV